MPVKTDNIIEYTGNAGVDIEGVKLLDNFAEFNDIVTPPTPDANKSRIYTKGGLGAYILFPSGQEKKFQLDAAGGNLWTFQRADYNSNLGNLRVRSLTASASHRFTLFAPPDAVAIQNVYMMAIPSAGVAGSGKDIDLSSQYGAMDGSEVYYQHAESSLAATYDFTGLADKIVLINVNAVFSAFEPNDGGGVLVDQNSIGGTMYYLGVAVEYSK